MLAFQAAVSAKRNFNQLTNRLQAQLRRFYPQVLALSPAAKEPRIWALLEAAPTPQRARRLRRRRVERLLRTHRIRRVSAQQVLDTLEEPALRVAPGTTEAATAHIALLIRTSRLVTDQCASVTRRIEALLDQIGSDDSSALEGSHAEDDDNQREHRDVDIVLSAPGIGTVVAATMLAEAYQALTARDYHTSRSQLGSAPVTRRSGRRYAVRMRQACNNRLRNAPYRWALAASRGVSRPGATRLLHLLHLLKLTGGVHEIIFDLPRPANGCSVSERALRPLLAPDATGAQLEVVRELLGHLVRTEA